jgi:hypothetical protein
MPEPTLDWSTAEVKDSKLTVQVEGDLPDGWQDTFNTTVKLLGGGSWGEIKLEEQKAEVSDLSPGSEEKLKHFLESVVLQANATHHTDEDEEQGEGEDGEDREDEDGSEQESDSDKEMSKRFQSFAEGEDSEEGKSDHDDSGDEDSDDDSSE